MTSRAGLALVTLLAMSGCGGRYLSWRALPPAPSPAGRIAVEIQDRREPRKGGERPEEIGVRTNAWGIPTEIRLQPYELAESLQDFIAQAALASGIGVARRGQEGSVSARVVVEVQTFWCTGYSPVFKANITAGVTVVDPATNQIRVPAQPLIIEGGGMNCHSIYRKLLSDLFNQATALFSAGPVHDAAIAAAAPTPAQ